MYVCAAIAQRRLDSELERMLEGIEQKRVGKIASITYLHAYMYTNIYIHSNNHIYIHTYIHTYTQIYCTHKYIVHIKTHTCIYIHTYIHK